MRTRIKKERAHSFDKYTVNGAITFCHDEFNLRRDYGALRAGESSLLKTALESGQQLDCRYSDRSPANWKYTTWILIRTFHGTLSV